MMSDLISRQAAIDAFDSYILDETTDLNGNTVREVLEKMPSTQPERKKGKWIHDKDDTLLSGYCSRCGWESIIMETDVADMPYCPNCGADMRGEDDDTK